MAARYPLAEVVLALECMLANQSNVQLVKIGFELSEQEAIAPQWITKYAPRTTSRNILRTMTSGKAATPLYRCKEYTRTTMLVLVQKAAFGYSTTNEENGGNVQEHKESDTAEDLSGPNPWNGDVDEPLVRASAPPMLETVLWCEAISTRGSTDQS